jgi:hypothetical protein
LPAKIKGPIEQSLAPLSEEQRRALLADAPPLRNLSPAEIDAIVTQLALEIPYPEPVFATWLDAHTPVPAGFFPGNAQGLYSPKVRQTFTAEKTGHLTSVELYLRNIGSAPQSPIKVTVSGSQGTIAEGVIQPYASPAGTSSPFEWKRVELSAEASSAPAAVEAGKEYSITAIASPDTSTYAWGRIGDVYSGGGSSLEDGRFIPDDLGFRAYVGRLDAAFEPKQFGPPQHNGSVEITGQSQTFTAVQTGTLAAIDLYVLDYSGQKPTINITVYDESGFNILNGSSVVQQGGTFLWHRTPMQPMATPDGDATLKAGKIYTIKAHAVPSSGAYWGYHQGSLDAYPGGSSSLGGFLDFGFRTYINQCLQNCPSH